MSELGQPEVDILLATYNGEKYIKDQLNSILYQTFQNWRLIIRDDGSSDRTVEILNHYKNLDSRILIANDTKGNLGVFENFMELICLSSSPYIMLADQDDIWINNKVSVSLSFIKKVADKNSPVLVFSNSILTNESLTKKFGLNYSMREKPSLSNFLFYNAGYQGANMIFNLALKKKLFPFFNNTIVHDYHISIVGLLLGKVYHIDEPLMLYRRHESATTIQNLTIFSRFRWFIKKKSFIYDQKMLDYLDIFVQYYKDSINEENKSCLDDYFKITKGKVSIFSKINLVLRNKFTLRGTKLYLILKLFTLR